MKRSSELKPGCDVSVAVRGWIALGLFAPLAWFGLLMLPTYTLAPKLDLSWGGALPYFATRGFRFGQEIIFTYGPLGHLTGYVYTGLLSSERTIWEFIVKGIFVLLFCAVLCSLRVIEGVLLALCIILFLGNYEEAYTFAIISAGLLLLDPVYARPRFAIALAVLLAVLALVKFDYFLAASVTIALTLTYHLYRRRWSFATLLGASFIAGLLVLWLVTGQHLGDFAVYIAKSWQIATGYGSAMFTPTANPILVWIALLGCLLLTLQLVFYASYAQDKIRTIVGSLFLLAMLFVLWRHSFVRWENHAYKFFSLFPAIALAAGTLLEQTVRMSMVPRVVGLLPVLSIFLGMETFDKAFISASGKSAFDKTRSAWHFVTSYQSFDRGRRSALEKQQREDALPLVKSTVTGQTIDVLGYRQGIALLNDLNYFPRPIFQGYSAYTPSLIQINTGYYESEMGPQFVLSRLETIDNRFPTLDDSGVLVQLLSRYQPVVSEKDWQLWRASRNHETDKPRLLSAFSLRFNQEVPLSQSRFIWAEVMIHETWLGKIVGFLYKTAPIFIELRNEAGAGFRYRIVPTMSASGFLLNPQLQTNEDLVAAARGAPLHHYASMKLLLATSGKRYFKREVAVRLYGVPSLDRLPSSPQNEPNH